MIKGKEVRNFSIVLQGFSNAKIFSGSPTIKILITKRPAFQLQINPPKHLNHSKINKLLNADKPARFKLTNYVQDKL